MVRYVRDIVRMDSTIGEHTDTAKQLPCSTKIKNKRCDNQDE